MAAAKVIVAVLVMWVAGELEMATTEDNEDRRHGAWGMGRDELDAAAGEDKVKWCMR